MDGSAMPRRRLKKSIFDYVDFFQSHSQYKVDGQGKPYYTWYVKNGLQLRFIVRGWDECVDGVAAVMVYGSILGEPIEVKESEENNEEENDREGEEQLSRCHLFNVYSSLIRACPRSGKHYPIG